MIKFLSVDSSLRNTGIAVGHYKKGEITIEHILLNQTEKEKNKKIRVSSDTVNRCRSNYDFVHEAIEEYKPQVVFVETPSGSQSSSAMKSYGATCQLIASIKPIPIEVTPIEAKMDSVGKKTASKREIIEWAHNKYPNIQWLTRKVKGEITLIDKNEHMADAIAIAYAAVKTPLFSNLLKLI